MSEATVSLAQLERIIRRMRHAKPGDPEFIRRRLMERFLDGHLLDENPHSLARIIDVSEQIARLVGTLGLSQFAVWPDGSSRRAKGPYGALWPLTVHWPLTQEFEHVALIDTTVSVQKLVEAGRVRIKTDDRADEPLSWPDGQPVQHDERGRPLKRYVVFTSLTSSDGLETRLEEDQCPMSLLEAVQLVGQSGGRFVTDCSPYILGQSEPVEAWMQMVRPEETSSKFNVVEVNLSSFESGTTFTHNIMVRSRHVIPVD